jgi:hypothetical protein
MVVQTAERVAEHPSEPWRKTSSGAPALVEVSVTPGQFENEDRLVGVVVDERRDECGYSVRLPVEPPIRGVLARDSPPPRASKALLDEPADGRS